MKSLIFLLLTFHVILQLHGVYCQKLISSRNSQVLKNPPSQIKPKNQEQTIDDLIDSIFDTKPVKNSQPQEYLTQNQTVDDLIDSVFDIKPVINSQPQVSVPKNQDQTIGDLIESVFEINDGSPKTSYDTPDGNIIKSLESSSEQNSIHQIEKCKCVSPSQCKIQQIKTGRCSNNNHILCCIETVLTTTPKPRPSSPIVSAACGIRNPEGVGFHVAKEENETYFGEFPWMVAVLYETTVDGNHKFNIYQCGGSLIHPKVVLTAAHCVNNKTKHESLKIRAGEWDTQTVNEFYPHQDRKVAFVQVHEKFVDGRLFNDIALLFLETPVEISENVNVVCLPPKQLHIDPSRKCIATGWGKDSFSQESQFKVILKKIELPYVPRKECVQSLRKTRLGKMFALHSSFICAGGEEGKDTCKGDGGSPLVCPIRNKTNQYQQIGIVSWGIGCGENNTPGVYVNIPYLRNWIDEKMAVNKLNQTCYTF